MKRLPDAKFILIREILTKGKKRFWILVIVSAIFFSLLFFDILILIVKPSLKKICPGKNSASRKKKLNSAALFSHYCFGHFFSSGRRKEYKKPQWHQTLIFKTYKEKYPTKIYTRVCLVSCNM